MTKIEFEEALNKNKATLKAKLEECFNQLESLQNAINQHKQDSLNYNLTYWCDKNETIFTYKKNRVRRRNEETK